MSSLTTFLQDLIRIPSLSASADETRAGQRMVAELQTLGFDAAWIDAKGNTFGLYRGTELGPAWLLLTHLDIVSVGDLALWKHPPFDAVLENGIVHGRGAVDIKGPLAAQVYAVAELIGQGERPPRTVVVMAAAEEETAGQGAEYFVRNLPLRTPAGDEIEFAACIVGEPSGNRVMLGHRGVARFILKFTGKAHHASRAIADVNPYFALGTFLERLSETRLRNHPIVGPSSIAPTMILADTRSQNVTPNAVELLLDWRFSSETQADMQALFEELTTGLNVEFTTQPAWAHGTHDARFAGPNGQNTPGFSIERDHPLVKLLDSTLRTVNPTAAEPGVWLFATDGRFLADLGVPTVGFGPGDELLAHTTNEKIGIDELELNIAVLTKILRGSMP